MTGSTPLSPTAGTERIQILDVLRGVALLGILIRNIQHFSTFAELEGTRLWTGTFSPLASVLPIGPAEWVWRSISYGKWQPMRVGGS